MSIFSSIHCHIKFSIVCQHQINCFLNFSSGAFTKSRDFSIFVLLLSLPLTFYQPLAFNISVFLVGPQEHFPNAYLHRDPNILNRIVVRRIAKPPAKSIFQKKKNTIFPTSLHFIPNVLAIKLQWKEFMIIFFCTVSMIHTNLIENIRKLQDCQSYFFLCQDVGDSTLCLFLLSVNCLDFLRMLGKIVEQFVVPFSIVLIPTAIQLSLPYCLTYFQAVKEKTNLCFSKGIYVKVNIKTYPEFELGSPFPLSVWITTTLPTQSIHFFFF